MSGILYSYSPLTVRFASSQANPLQEARCLADRETAGRPTRGMPGARPLLCRLLENSWRTVDSRGWTVETTGVALFLLALPSGHGCGRRRPPWRLGAAPSSTSLRRSIPKKRRSRTSEADGKRAGNGPIAVEKYLARIERVDRRDPPFAASSKPTRTRQPSPTRWTRSAKWARPEGRCTASRCWSRTMSTADRMTTTAGSLALEGSIPEGRLPRHQLRAAGAVILGKANLASGQHPIERSSSGWSARGGQARNPDALDRNTSGSSWARRRGLRQPERGHGRHRNRRFDRQPLELERRRRDEADGGLVSRTEIVRFPNAGHRRADGANGGRRCHPARRDDRGGPATRRPPPQGERPRDYTTSLDAGGLKGAASASSARV